MSDKDINGEEIKKKYFKVAHDTAFFITSLEELAGQLDAMEDTEEVYELSVVYMTPTEYEALPDFGGF